MDAILLSAGIGTRTKLNYPKQFMRLGGKPLFIHCLEILRSIDNIDKIIITVISDHIDQFEQLINQYQISNVQCIIGGLTRQESVFNALRYCDTRRVLIHEAARPFINKEFVQSLMKNGSIAIVPCVGVTSTIVDTREHFLERNNVKLVQLPQIYKLNLLKEAHFSAMKNNRVYTDDSSLFSGETGIFPTLLDGLDENIKITTPLDVRLAEVIYEEISNSHRW